MGLLGQMAGNAGNHVGTSLASVADEEGHVINLYQLADGSERVEGMIVRSAQLRKVLKTVARLSPYKSTVLISGESGTGKEHIARALHMMGGAPTTPFVIFNCSNLL